MNLSSLLSSGGGVRKDTVILSVSGDHYLKYIIICWKKKFFILLHSTSKYLTIELAFKLGPASS